MNQVVERTTDQRIVLQGTWDKFKLLQQVSEDSPGIRLFYYDGTIEILMPGIDHEFFKSIIGMLIEAFFIERNIEFAPTGSVTQERERVASVQADESYCIGQPKTPPDLVIEVVFSSGGTNKLQRYQALGVPEVWFWEDGLFKVYHLRQDGYQRIDHSEVLIGLDIALLTQCVLIAQTSRLEALRTFKRGIQSVPTQQED